MRRVLLHGGECCALGFPCRDDADLLVLRRHGPRRGGLPAHCFRAPWTAVMAFTSSIRIGNLMMSHPAAGSARGPAQGPRATAAPVEYRLGGPQPETRGLVGSAAPRLVATVLCAIVVVVGAWVRLTNAGLGCPGLARLLRPHPSVAGRRDVRRKSTPPSGPALRYQKAINEMVHRYIVGALGLSSIGPRGVLDREPPRSCAAARPAAR